MTQPREALVVENLHKSFGGLEVLKGISMTAHEHGVVSILGSSGSGKSTFLRCINLLEIPNAGNVSVQGELIRMRRLAGRAPVPEDRRQVARIRARLGPAPGTVPASARRPRPMPSPWKLSTALVLLAVLAGAGTVVEAASDPAIEAVQQALVERGYDPGKVDGAMGRRTRGALRTFQRSVGLSDTGEIDHATVTALGLESSAGTQTPAQADTPPADTRPARVPGVERAPMPSDASTSETPGAETAPERDADKPASEAPRAESGPAVDTPGTGTAETEPAPKPAPKPAAKPILRFATLGWHRPQTGAEALERFNAIGAPRDFKRGTGSLFVPKSELVFVLQSGELVPGLDCDPGAGRISVEFVFGPDGPVIFTAAAGGELCQIGIGIALEVGRNLEMRRVDWGGVQYPQGTVRITNEGLQYAR